MSRFASPARAPRGLPATPGAPRARQSPLASAIRRTPEDGNALIVAMQADPDELFVLLPGGKRALGYAIQHNRSPAFLRTLLGGGAPVNIPDADGTTPLQQLLNTEPDREIPAWNAMPAFAAPWWAAAPAAPARPYRRQHQVRLVGAAIVLLQGGAQAPGGEVAAAPGNEACASCVEQYWDAILAASLRHGITSGRLDAFWGDIDGR